VLCGAEGGGDVCSKGEEMMAYRPYSISPELYATLIYLLERNLDLVKSLEQISIRRNIKGSGDIAYYRDWRKEIEQASKRLKKRLVLHLEVKKERGN
jgi:hypothetical protein